MIMWRAIWWNELVVDIRPEVEGFPENVQLPFYKRNVVFFLLTTCQAV